MAKSRDQHDPPGGALGIDPIEQREELVGFDCGTTFDPHRIGNATQIFDMRAARIAGTVAEPQAVRRERPPAAVITPTSRQRRFVIEQQRLVAREHWAARPAGS